MPNNNGGLIERVRDCLHSQVFIPDQEKALRDVQRLIKLEHEGRHEAAERHKKRMKRDTIRNYDITELAELGDGIVLIRDNTGRWEAYFDAEQWEARPPYTPEHLELFPHPVKARGLGTFAPLHIPYDLQEITHLTRTCLQPTRRSEGFYDEPVQVKYTGQKGK